MIIHMKNTKYLNLITIIFLVLSLQSCYKRPKPVPAPINWISEDPLTIPYRIREQKFEKGNLVWNGSFEAGKNLIIDSTGVTYRIDGWYKTGDNVEWVNIEADSIYSKDEAYDSIRAVKIHRIRADETDDLGEGIMSDFIKIIPGNYELTYYLRLENIRANKARLGTRIYDAVNIRLIFFDKNKIEIDSKKFDPNRKVFYDNSFKGYSFSNFWKIDKMPWSRIIGKSSDAYLIDGDVPGDARYAKIYLGLKGTGTMWVDQIDFRYTRQNFSFIERMEKLMDTTLFKQEIIIPTPKSVKKLASILYLDTAFEVSSRPVILVPKNAPDVTRMAAGLIHSKIKLLIEKSYSDKTEYPKIYIKTELTTNELNNSKLIFSIGKTDLYNRFHDILPDVELLGSDQGYYIFTATDLNNVIFIFGKNTVSDFYGATTVIQLFDSKKLIFHNANIIDYPDFCCRNIRIDYDAGSESILNDVIDQIIQYKINGCYLFSLKAKNGSLNNFAARIENRLFSRDVFNPGLSGDIISCENLMKNNKIQKLVLLPNYMLSNSEPDNNVSRSVMMDYVTVANNKNQSAPLSDLKIIPYWFNNKDMDGSEGRAELYLGELKSLVTGGFHYFWSGSSVNSMGTDDADIMRISNILDTKPCLWDNSMTFSDTSPVMEYYAGKISLYNVFEPFENNEVKYLYENLDKSEVFFNSSPQSELGIIKTLTIADFAWNMNNYDADLSLWKILQSRYGIASAKELVLFADTYASLLRYAVELKNPMHYQRLVRNTESLQMSLEEHMNNITEILGKDNRLVYELREKSDSLKNQIDGLLP